MIFLLLTLAFAEKYVDIVHEGSKDCKVVLEIVEPKFKKRYEKLVKECKLEENETEIKSWFRRVNNE